MHRKFLGRRYGVPAVIATITAGAALALSAGGASALVAGQASLSAARPAPAAALTPKATQRKIVRAALPSGAIKHIFVILLENSSENVTFGTSDAHSYLESTLEKQGVLVPHFYASGHASLDNYIASVSGQAPAPATSSDCSFEPGDAGTDVDYDNVEPGTMANQTTYPGQVNASSGCVYPSSVETIANQLDSRYGVKSSGVAPWRDYEQDMGDDPARDHGVSDPLGGTDCAHPAIGAANNTNSAEASDQWAMRHDPFQWFHAIIDNTKLCDHNVVPLGRVAVGTPSRFDGTKLANTFSGHLARDLKSVATTPKFGWITPNLCNDGHDSPCAGHDADGKTTTSGHQLQDINEFLKQWVPLLEASPAYKQGHMLIVISADEAETPAGGTTVDASQLPGVPPGPSLPEPGAGDIPYLSALGFPDPTVSPANAPGGGEVGALILGSSKYIKHGTVDTTGAYDQYSALRSYEDLLGITAGGSDHHGHLGYAGLSVLKPFGSDVFNAYKAGKHNKSHSAPAR